MGERYYCTRRQRRTEVQKHPTLNGIDFLEVGDVDVPDVGFKQRVLLLRCLKPLAVAQWSRDNIAISGGVRVTGIKVSFAGVLSGVNTAQFPPVQGYLNALKAAPGADQTLLIVTSVAGDFSDYELTLRASAVSQLPPPNFDPMLAAVTFRFKAECPSDFDCRPETVCLTTAAGPELDYLAKDYASFRQLMLDRLAVLMPDWRERNAADLQIALVELLAYAGDHLSYFQDWVATEAYLGTARSRVSVRRHARLLDYFLHDGTNARTWIVFKVDNQGDGLLLPAGTPVLSGMANAPVIMDAADYKPLTETAVIFETMTPVTLREAHNCIDFYTWSDEDCCLACGATSATLVHKNGMSLEPGKFLLFEEVRNPETGERAGLDRSHRHAVRLTAARGLDDQAKIEDPLTGTRVVEIKWHEEDGLPFPLCISHTVTRADGTEQLVGRIAVARANVAPADHGASIPAQEPVPGKVPKEGVFRPLLTEVPVTQAAPPIQATDSAAAALRTDPAAALPVLKMRETPVSGTVVDWEPTRDLLSAGALLRKFVLEIEADGSSAVRFGDGQHGREPDAGSAFAAIYRLGTGPAGNVGADVLTRVVFNVPGITSVRNPLPGTGGRAMEAALHAQLVAPQAFRVQKRAVTEADYAATARLHREVQNATARFRWTGSWYTVYLTVDRTDGRPLDAPFRRSLLGLLDRYRMARHDLELRPPKFVPLDLLLQICVAPGFFSANVKRAVLEALSSRTLPGGALGFFHADRFTFAQPVYLSRVYQAALAVPGVDSVLALRFQRYGWTAAGELDDGFIPAGETEILRLDNDPNFPENGRLELDMRGGL